MEVNVKDYVVVLYMDLEEMGEDGEGFMDNYILCMMMNFMDSLSLLWDIYIFNVKILDVEVVGVVSIYYMLGDGMFMVFFLFLCMYKMLDYNSVLIIILLLKWCGSYKNKGWFLSLMFIIGFMMMLIWNMIVDMLLFFVILLFLKDMKMYIKGGVDVGSNLKSFYYSIMFLDYF